MIDSEKHFEYKISYYNLKNIYSNYFIIILILIIIF